MDEHCLYTAMYSHLSHFFLLKTVCIVLLTSLFVTMFLKTLITFERRVYLVSTNQTFSKLSTYAKL